MSNVNEKTSVLTTSFSRLEATGVPDNGVLGGTADELVAAAIVGTDVTPLDGAADVEDEGVTAATAGAVGFGKNVAFCPLKTCHWSHNRTIEKPKITHKMVRRMSFMTVSFQMMGKSLGPLRKVQRDGKKGAAREPGRAHPCTKAGSELNGRASRHFLPERLAAQALAGCTRSMSAQTGKRYRAKGLTVRGTLSLGTLKATAESEQ